MKQKKKNVRSPLLKYIPTPNERKSSGLNVPASDDSLPPLINKRRKEKVTEEQFIPVHLTVRMHPLLTGRRLTLVVGQFLYSVCTSGVTIEDIIFLECLLSRILGQKTSPLLLKKPKNLNLFFVFNQ